MPAALEYIADPASQELRALEEAFAKEYDERAARFKLHWDYYDGAMPEPLRREADGVNDNILLGKVDQIADKTVSFLLGSGVQFDAGGEGERSAEDEAIAALWQANRGQLLLHSMALSGAMTGHVFVRVEPAEGRPPRLVNVNPAYCSTFWDMAEIDRVLWYRLQYALGAQGKRIDYVRGRPLPEDQRGWDHGADAWEEIVCSRGALGEWQETRRQTLEVCPIVEWQNLPRPFVAYGTDDVRRAVALNNAINLIASDWNRVLKYHAAPRTIGLGMTAEDVKPSGVGGFYTVAKPKNEAEVYNLEMKSDLKASQELLAMVMREAWQSARLVDPQTVKDQVGQLTNFGLKVLFSDALKKTETKRLLYADGFERTIRTAFAVARQEGPATVRTTWPDVLPEDPNEVATALLKELEAEAIDMQTYRELRNYDHEQIEERLEAQRSAKTSLGDLVLSAFERNGQLNREGR